MADVVLRFRAESAEAIAKTQQLSRAVEESLRKVQAGDPALRTATAATKSLAAAKGEAAHATDVFTRALTGVPGPLGQAASQVSQLTAFLSGPAGLAAGILAAGTAIVGMASQFANTIERLENLSTQTGLSVGALQTLEQAAKEAGQAPDALVQGFGKVNAAIADALLGNEQAGKSFKAIGIDLKGLVAQGASTEEIFQKVAEAVKGIDDPTRRAAIAWEIFGLRGRAASVLVDQIATQGLPALRKEMQAAGIETSAFANRMAKEIDTMADHLSRSFAGMLNSAQTLAAGLLLVFTKNFSELSEMAEQFGKSQAGKLNLGALGVSPDEAMRLLGQRLETGGLSAADASRVIEQVRALMSAKASTLIEERIPPGTPDRKATLDALEQVRKLIEASNPALDAYGKAWLEVKDAMKGLEGEIPTDRFEALSGALMKNKTAIFEHAQAIQNARGEMDKDLKVIDEVQEALGKWGLELIGTLVPAFDQTNAIIDMSVGLQQTWGIKAEDAREIAISAAHAVQQLAVANRGAAQSFRLLGPEADKVEQEMRDLASAFAAIERFEFGLEGRGIPIPRETVKRFSDTLKTELAQGIGDAIAQAARTGDIGGAFESLGQRLGQQAGGAFSQALTQVLTGQTTATTTGDLVASGGVVVGTTAGTHIGGGGGGASTGAVLGSVVGGVAGSYYGPAGTAVGAVAGGVIGGYLGGLFDPSDLAQALHDFRSRLRDQTSAAFGQGIAEAVKTGDVDGAFEHVADNLTEIIQGAVITAFVETAVIKGAMGPLIDAISDAMEQGLGPTAFMRHILPGLEQFRGRLDMLRPLFGEMVGVFGDIGAILHGNATVTDQWRMSLEGAADAAGDIQGSIEAIPSDIDVNVTRHDEGGGTGFQHGGIVTRGAVSAVLHGPEAVIPLDRLERMLEGGTDEDRALMREQNALLRQLVSQTHARSRRGAPV